MLERMTRGKFAKLLAAAPMVALALKSDGSRNTAEAQALPVCTIVGYYCNPQLANPCKGTCDLACDMPTYRDCPACTSRSC